MDNIVETNDTISLPPDYSKYKKLIFVYSNSATGAKRQYIHNLLLPNSFVLFYPYQKYMGAYGTIGGDGTIHFNTYGYDETIYLFSIYGCM